MNLVYISYIYNKLLIFFFSVPPSSNASQDTKDSDNNDVVYIESTECLKNNNGVIEATDNPFRFGGNLDNTRHTPRSETAINTKTKEQTISQDNTSITINTITN